MFDNNFLMTPCIVATFVWFPNNMLNFSMDQHFLPQVNNDLWITLYRSVAILFYSYLLSNIFYAVLLRIQHCCRLHAFLGKICFGWNFDCVKKMTFSMFGYKLTRIRIRPCPLVPSWSWAETAEWDFIWRIRTRLLSSSSIPAPESWDWAIKWTGRDVLSWAQCSWYQWNAPCCPKREYESLSGWGSERIYLDIIFKP